jgi:hypothetical protein
MRQRSVNLYVKWQAFLIPQHLEIRGLIQAPADIPRQKRALSIDGGVEHI